MLCTGIFRPFFFKCHVSQTAFTEWITVFEQALPQYDMNHMDQSVGSNKRRNMIVCICGLTFGVFRYGTPQRPSERKPQHNGLYEG